jgi:hypothetical protein
LLIHAHQPAEELLRERVVHDQCLILSHSPEAFPLPQTLYFGFKHSDAPVAVGKGGFDIGGLKTLRDVLRAIPIPSEHLEKHPLLPTRSVTGPRRLRYQLGVVFDYLGFSPNLDTLPVCIVHPGLLSTRRFSIAIATDQQISKTDRTQTADTLCSLDAFS